MPFGLLLRKACGLNFYEKSHQNEHFFCKSVAEFFEDFVLSQTAKNLSETTIRTYHAHIHSISKHLDIQKPMDKLTKKDLEAMVVSMRRAGLAHNSISSYCRVLRTFLNWCNAEGFNAPLFPTSRIKKP